MVFVFEIVLTCFRRFAKVVLLVSKTITVITRTDFFITGVNMIYLLSLTVQPVRCHNVLKDNIYAKLELTFILFFGYLNIGEDLF